MANSIEDEEAIDPKKHLIQLDLAVYDQNQWNKIVVDIMKAKLGNSDVMSCEERLSHAI